jgi:hypothetical protein
MDHRPPGGRERRDVLDSSLDCDVIARRPALGHGEASAQAFGVLWRPYSSVGALRTGFLSSGQLTGVIVVLADDAVERALVVVAHPPLCQPPVRQIELLNR